MNIKKMFVYAMSVMALGLGSCSSDEPINGGDQKPTEQGDLYAKIQLYLPGVSRSATDEFDGNDNSEAGFEIGKTYENTVNDVTVVLATKEDDAYTPIAVSTSSAVPATGFDEQRPVFNILFRQDDIRESAGKTVYLFAFCNAQKRIADLDEDFNNSNFVDMVTKITSDAANQDIWANGNFLMANAPNIAIPTKLLPEEKELTTAYNTPQKALDLGIVDVARVCSRFDFKQVNDNVYPIYDANLDKDGNQVLVANVKLLAMAPVNIAKEFYYLPRVSADGTNSSRQLCGVENRNNFVVSPNWADKSADKLTAGDAILAKYFRPTPSTGDYGDTKLYEYTELAEFNGEDDNDDNWNGGEGFDKTGYKIWRYVTENTLPSVASQKKGISTGVVFKAEIVDPQDATLAAAMDSKKAVYYYNGTLYGDVVALRKVAGSVSSTNPLYKAYAKVFGEAQLEKDKDGKFVVADTELQDCTAAANANTFKILRPTDGHYYVYYLYRNRHNDNGNPNEMAAMEFGTVRNNIYKLAVTTITDFGHTGDPNDDPDPDDPDDPDEDPKTYLKVSCRVVPWMVRINNIEF